MGCQRIVRFHTIGKGRSLQRLFSTFPDGWPGRGLLLLRIGAAIPLIYLGIAGGAGHSLDVALHLIEVAGGLLLLLGLWTPLTGILIAMGELWSAFSLRSVPQDDQGLRVVLAVLAAGLAMLGPGAWSVDARHFGRKRFKVNGRDRRNTPTK